MNDVENEALENTPVETMSCLELKTVQKTMDEIEHWELVHIATQAVMLA